MKTIGIVGEYNPFHIGHAWHIRESVCRAATVCTAQGAVSEGDKDIFKEMTDSGETEEIAVIAVMSGDFVQRGEAAVFSKYARAEAACRSGIDLVVELPLPWALSSAEGFARGAVALLAELGADALSFGCEITEERLCANEPDVQPYQTAEPLPVNAKAGSVLEYERQEAQLSALEELAELLLQPEFTDDVLRMLKDNPTQSFASARQSCAEKRIGKPLPLLQKPNSILAIEYLKSIRSLNLTMKPLLIPRQGASHDERGESPVPSASELRSRLREKRVISSFLPHEAEEVFRREAESGRTALDPKRQDLLMLSRLRALREEDCLCLPDAGVGLGKLLYRAVRNENSYEAILSAVATRRYPLARVRRLCTAAVLGLREEDRRGMPPFVRVLAFNERGRTVLSRLVKKESTIPMIVKPAHVRRLDGRSQRIFALGADAHDFYTLHYSDERERSCGEDWRKGPAIC